VTGITSQALTTTRLELSSWLVVSYTTNATFLTGRATANPIANYAAIFHGFTATGISEADIRPRENVLTFNAWKALGRSVKKSEHGVKVVTFIDRTVTERDPSSGEERETSYRQPHTTTVFHISQTETDAERQARFSPASRLAPARSIGRARSDYGMRAK
jgi:antirestriction protein ArdC